MTEERPIVFTRAGKKRKGRGFSIPELKKANLSMKEAMKIGVRADPRRKTDHPANVEIIKSFLSEISFKRANQKKPKS